MCIFLIFQCGEGSHTGLIMVQYWYFLQFSFHHMESLLTYDSSDFRARVRSQDLHHFLSEDPYMEWIEGHSLWCTGVIYGRIYEGCDFLIDSPPSSMALMQSGTPGYIRGWLLHKITGERGWMQGANHRCHSPQMAEMMVSLFSLLCTTTPESLSLSFN